MKTTLNKIREHSPCREGWEKLLNHLGKTKADDEELSLLTVLDNNGIQDAIWCFRAVDGFDDEILAFARFCALQNFEKIKPYTSDENYLLITRWLQTGNKSIQSAAWSAARSAARSARSAARSAVWSAARSAVWSAAWSAESVESAARSVAWSAAWSAARSAARSAWSATESAGSAAESAAWSAAEAELRRIWSHNENLD